MARPVSQREASLLLWTDKQRERQKANSSLFLAVDSRASLPIKSSWWMLYELLLTGTLNPSISCATYLECLLHSGSLT